MVFLFNLLQVTTLLLYFHRVGISFVYNKSNKQVNQILIDIYSIWLVVLKDYAFVIFFRTHFKYQLTNCNVKMFLLNKFISLS